MALVTPPLSPGASPGRSPAACVMTLEQNALSLDNVKVSAQIAIDATMSSPLSMSMSPPASPQSGVRLTSTPSPVLPSLSLPSRGVRVRLADADAFVSAIQNAPVVIPQIKTTTPSSPFLSRSDLKKFKRKQPYPSSMPRLVFSSSSSSSSSDSDEQIPLANTLRSCVYELYAKGAKSDIKICALKGVNLRRSFSAPSVVVVHNDPLTMTSSPPRLAPLPRSAPLRRTVSAPMDIPIPSTQKAPSPPPLQSNAATKGLHLTPFLNDHLELPTDLLASYNPRAKIHWKGPSLPLSHLPHVHLMHTTEQLVSSILRLTPEQYLLNKLLILEGAQLARERGAGFRKSDAQKCCRIDVNKASRLWEFFGSVGWM